MRGITINNKATITIMMSSGEKAANIRVLVRVRPEIGSNPTDGVLQIRSMSNGVAPPLDFGVGRNINDDHSEGTNLSPN